MKQSLQFTLLLLAGLIFNIKSINAQNNTSSERTANFNLEKNVAIQGYDPVTYFTLGKAVKGKKEILNSYNGVTYYFSSKDNADLFKANPLKFEPQYGGWCAYAMGYDGSKVEIDPETFKIMDGKLYLFYNFYFNNTMKKWNNNEVVLKKNADTNWTKIINK